jgi:hypothetical protein
VRYGDEKVDEKRRFRNACDNRGSEMAAQGPRNRQVGHVIGRWVRRREARKAEVERGQAQAGGL